MGWQKTASWARIWASAVEHVKNHFNTLQHQNNSTVHNCAHGNNFHTVGIFRSIPFRSVGTQLWELSVRAVVQTLCKWPVFEFAQVVPYPIVQRDQEFFLSQSAWYRAGLGITCPKSFQKPLWVPQHTFLHFPLPSLAAS